MSGDYTTISDLSAYFQTLYTGTVFSTITVTNDGVSDLQLVGLVKSKRYSTIQRYTRFIKRHK